ncbi:hypothetical protein ACFFHM_17750 [Halalkalibacter kiskunsagensis]|uniref:Uncharacterized protein n=1 Tax=Halalkalibacter kiskunsagensis TaxID=1548599 RepID=A0ABV6KG60_9BACI
MKYILIFGVTFILGLIIIGATGSEIGFYIISIFPFVLYLILISFIVWFAITLIKLQRERNNILAEIANKLEKENR